MEFKPTFRRIIFLLPAVFIICAETLAQQNFIRTWNALAPESNAGTLMTRPLKDVRQTTQYFDGLGRPLQTVIKGGSLQTDPVNPVSSASAVDLVTAMEYDEYGREANQHLPFAANNAGGNTSISDGLFKTNPLQQQVAFMSAQYGSQGETMFYGKTVFETSPLNRATENYAPGNNWVGTASQPIENNRRGTKIKYWLNTANDDVKKWTVTNFYPVGTQWGTYNMAGAYTGGQLRKQVTVDEHGKQVIEFIDKRGHLILKKIQLTASADDGSGSSYTGWLCTYYIYDDHEQLRAVLQPSAVEELAKPAVNWQLSTVVLDELTFRYEYDNFARMIMKKVPGAGVMYMVYDVRDRLVFVQDANLRASNNWLASLYDGLNRQVMTGMITYSGSRADLQDVVTTQTTTPVNPPSGPTLDLVLNSATSGGIYQAARSITMDPGFETNTSAEVIAEIVNGPGGNDGETTVVEGVLINKYPVPPGVTFNFLTINFYDDYSWTANIPVEYRSFESGYNGSFHTPSNNNWPYAQALQSSSRTNGMITGTMVKTLGGLNTVVMAATNFYDDYGRLIQKKSANLAGGFDISTTQYTFSGHVLKTMVRHQKPSPNTVIADIFTDSDYDELGRLIKIRKNTSAVVNGAAATTTGEVVLVQNEYDKLGQVKTKKIGRKKDINGNYTNDPVEAQTFDYNIRGWLLGVNRSEMLGDNGLNNRNFAFELGYEKLTNAAGRNFSAAQFNGNISGMIWETSGNGIRRKYDFSYDNARRLMKGQFEQHDLNGSWGISQADFTIKMGNDGLDVASAYDANGNIKKMQQWGLKVTGPAQVDNLAYNYIANSNKLQNVIDGNNDPQTKLGDFRSSSLYMAALGGSKTNAAVDYTYDVNGNLKKDRNKDIGDGGNDGITYNYLNLPSVITARTTGGAIKGTITYTYDALGNKLKKEVAETGQPIKTTLYLSGFVYEDNVMQFVGHEEGRIRFTPASGATPDKLHMDYFLRDHLSNVRMVLTDEQQQDVYPAATLEGNLNTSTDAAYIEKNYYSIDAAKVVNASEATGIPTYTNNNGNPPYNNNPNSNTTANSQKVYKLTATAGTNGGVTGLGFAIKVMGGDKIDIWGKSYYFTNNASENNYDVPVLNILEGFMGSPASPGAGKTTASEMNGVSLITSAIGGFLGHPNRNSDGISTTPKAYVNYIFLDDNFRYVSGGFSRVPSGPGSKQHHDDASMQAVNVPANGYLYVYVSNQSPTSVYFDNLQVIHTRGPVLEENHYYPFGLTMAGISSKALKPSYGENKNKFNGGNELQSKEFSDGSGLELYDARFRMYDPQIGRFNRIEPLADIFNDLTPYSYAYNNPISFNDRLGLNPTGFGDESNTGPQALKGWVRGGDGMVFFDRRVHSQDDIKKYGLTGTYLGEEIFVTDENGNRIWFGNDQGIFNPIGELAEVTVTAKRPGYDKWGENAFRHVSSYSHWSGTYESDTYVSRLDDGDAMRFFDYLKDVKKIQTGGDGAAFIPMKFWLGAALGALAILSEKQIDAIIDEYNKNGDKLGIKVKIHNSIDASTGNTWNYSISLIKNNEVIGHVAQIIMGPAM